MFIPYPKSIFAVSNMYSLAVLKVILTVSIVEQTTRTHSLYSQAYDIVTTCWACYFQKWHFSDALNWQINGSVSDQIKLDKTVFFFIMKVFVFVHRSSTQCTQCTKTTANQPDMWFKSRGPSFKQLQSHFFSRTRPIKLKVKSCCVLG